MSGVGRELAHDGVPRPGPAIAAADQFGVHIVGHDQHELAAGCVRSGIDRFAGGDNPDDPHTALVHHAGAIVPLRADDRPDPSAVHPTCDPGR